jgi:hypothetical protein
MQYPLDPNGPLGPEYPKGFEFWYGLIILIVVILGYTFL